MTQIYLHIKITQYSLYALLLIISSLDNCSSEPKTDLQATTFMKNGAKIFKFKCSSNFAFMGCTVEVIRNNRTYDYLRHYNNSCVHLYGKCNYTNCECSTDCKEFTWFVTAKDNTVNTTFGCRSRLKADDITYAAIVFVKYDIQSFIIINKTLDPIRLRGKISKTSTRPDNSDIPLGTQGWVIATFTFFGLFGVSFITNIIFVVQGERQRRHKEIQEPNLHVCYSNKGSSSNDVDTNTSSIDLENKQSPTSAYERDDDDSGFENNTVTQFDEMLSDSETHNC